MENIKEQLIAETTNLQEILSNTDNKEAMESFNKTMQLLFRLFDEIDEETEED